MAIETRGFRLSRFPGINVDMRVQGNTLSGLGRGIGQGLQALGQQRREGQQKAELEALRKAAEAEEDQLIALSMDVVNAEDPKKRQEILDSITDPSTKQAVIDMSAPKIKAAQEAKVDAEASRIASEVIAAPPEDQFEILAGVTDVNTRIAAMSKIREAYGAGAVGKGSSGVRQGGVVLDGLGGGGGVASMFTDPIEQQKIIDARAKSIAPYIRFSEEGEMMALPAELQGLPENILNLAIDTAKKTQLDLAKGQADVAKAQGDLKGAKELSTIFGFDIDPDERTFFNTVQQAQAANKDFPMPIDGESKIEYVTRIREPLAKFVQTNNKTLQELLFGAFFGGQGMGVTPDTTLAPDPNLPQPTGGAKVRRWDNQKKQFVDVP